MNLWSNEDNSINRVDTFHETKEIYVAYGKEIWSDLEFYHTEDDCMKRNFFFSAVKWLRYYYHQCNELLEVITDHNYSWYYIHCGQFSNHISIRSNEYELKEFDSDVLVCYTIYYKDKWPSLEELKR